MTQNPPLEPFLQNKGHQVRVSGGGQEGVSDPLVPPCFDGKKRGGAPGGLRQVSVRLSLRS